MNWIKYLKESERTLSTEFHCGSVVEKLLHGVIGILTEMDEMLENYKDDKFDSINIVEETGDIFWYLALLSRELNMDTLCSSIEEPIEKDPREIIILIIIDSLRLLDILKKKLYYNKEISDVIFTSLVKSIMVKLFNFVNVYNTDLGKILDTNIDKLRERYPDKFNSNLAINRNLENERKILEK